MNLVPLVFIIPSLRYLPYTVGSSNDTQLSFDNDHNTSEYPLVTSSSAPFC